MVVEGKFIRVGETHVVQREGDQTLRITGRKATPDPVAPFGPSQTVIAGEVLSCSVVGNTCLEDKTGPKIRLPI